MRMWVEDWMILMKILNNLQYYSAGLHEQPLNI